MKLVTSCPSQMKLRILTFLLLSSLLPHHSTSFPTQQPGRHKRQSETILRLALGLVLQNLFGEQGQDISAVLGPLLSQYLDGNASLRNLLRIFVREGGLRTALKLLLGPRGSELGDKVGDRILTVINNELPNVSPREMFADLLGNGTFVDLAGALIGNGTKDAFAILGPVIAQIARNGLHLNFGDIARSVLETGLLDRILAPVLGHNVARILLPILFDIFVLGDDLSTGISKFVTGGGLGNLLQVLFGSDGETFGEVVAGIVSSLDTNDLRGSWVRIIENDQLLDILENVLGREFVRVLRPLVLSVLNNPSSYDHPVEIPFSDILEILGGEGAKGLADLIRSLFNGSIGILDIIKFFTFSVILNPSLISRISLVASRFLTQFGSSIFNLPPLEKLLAGILWAFGSGLSLITKLFRLPWDLLSELLGPSPGWTTASPRIPHASAWMGPRLVIAHVS